MGKIKRWPRVSWMDNITELARYGYEVAVRSAMDRS